MTIAAFKNFAKEAALIGGLITTYSELEFDLCLCVSNGIDNLDTTVKALYRARGETQRLEIADALARQAYHAQKLGTQFEEAISGMKHCLRIRNQFAHGYFHDDNTGRLSFLNLEELAKENAVITDFNNLTFHYVDSPLLQSQTVFFKYVDDLLAFVNFEGRTRRGQIAKTSITAPAKVQPSPLHH